MPYEHSDTDGMWRFWGILGSNFRIYLRVLFQFVFLGYRQMYNRGLPCTGNDLPILHWPYREKRIANYPAARITLAAIFIKKFLDL